MNNKQIIAAIIVALAGALWGLPVLAQQPTAKIELELVAEVGLGQVTDINASLRAADGTPIPDSTVTVTVDTVFLNVFDETVIGSARTNEDGLAKIVYVPKTDGELNLIARFDGNATNGATEEFGTLVVLPGPATYEQESLFRIPGANLWVVVIVLVVVWSMYLSFVRVFWSISRDGNVERTDAEAQL